MTHKNICAEYTADTLGMYLKNDSFSVAFKATVEGPVDGLSIPLEMRYSHGNPSRAKGFMVNCYKVSGDLYIAVVVTPETGRSLDEVFVVMMDKAKWDRPENFVTTFTKANVKCEVDTFDQYRKLMRSAIIGIWKKKTPMSAEYIPWEDDVGALVHMD